MIGFIFLEVSGNEIAKLIICILLGIAIISGIIITVLTFLINIFYKKKKLSKGYYLRVFVVGGLIALIVSGMICGSMI